MSEAANELGDIYRRSVLYYAGTRSFESIAPVVPPRQFPIGAPRTPPAVPAGRRTVDVRGTWQHPTWQALDYTIDGPHYFAYEYDSAGVGAGASFTARAFGDLDGNGVFSTYERAAHVDEHDAVLPTGGLWVKDQVE